MARGNKKDIHRAFVAHVDLDKAKSGEAFMLPKDTAHRFLNVLRLQETDKVELFDGTGKQIFGTLAFKPLPQLQHISIGYEVNNSPPLWLAQAMTKLPKLEEVVQRTTEMGATKIILFEAKRSIVRLNDFNDKKIQRLERIAQDAARQCGRSHVPEILPIKFLDLVTMCSNFEGLSMVGIINTNSKLLSELSKYTSKLQDGTLIIIGPEGDLSEEEISSLLQAQVIGVNIGPHVLRTETAGLVALAIIQAYLAKILVSP